MKKNVLLFAALCLMLLAALPVFGQVRSTIRPGQPAKAIFIAMDSMDQHWLKLTQGCMQQATKLKIQFSNNAPAGKTDASQQVALVEDAITAKYDVILLAPLNAQALIPVVNKAKAAGIKVVLVDTGLGTGANYDTLIATDNAAAARMAADALAKEIGGSGKIAIVNAQAGAGTTMTRENAFKEQIQSKYPGITIVGTQYSDGDPTKALNIATDFMRANPDLKGIYACNEGASKGVGQAVKQAGKAGAVKVIGFDLSAEITALIKDGTMQGTMVQNPAAMGTKGIQAGVDLLAGKSVQKLVDSGVTLGTKANIDKLQ
ncbi:MAG: ABC transporter substrate-binding protein [Treponema sp.]|jgi:ribose transport system substrate-binding protein|nr:ABC transporter substrate-binding protein [Treponema sp.]